MSCFFYEKSGFFYAKVRGTINPKAHFFKNGNTKLGVKTWSFSKLNRDNVYVITDETKHTYTIAGSCVGHCDGCRAACYVNKSYARYSSVVKCHAENSIAFKCDLLGAFNDLRGQLARAKNKPKYVRINQSGEIESTQEFILWIETARMFPMCHFWLYTKSTDCFPLNVEIPQNMTINVSIWHEFGIDDFKQLSVVSDRVSAFVYDDEFNYPFQFKIHCPAYDKNGKMNHDMTCERCGLCMRGNGLVIGCYDH